jgi:hypothetical protein
LYLHGHADVMLMSCICGELLNTGKRGKKNRNRQHEELRVVDLWFLIICQC